MKYRPYAPTKGPIVRRKVLTELGRTPGPRPKFGISKTDVRHAVSSMLSFKPITPLNPRERLLLRAWANTEVTLSSFLNVNKASILASGELRSFEDGQTRIMTPPEIRRFYTGEKLEKGMKVKKPASLDPEFLVGSRGLDGYLSEGGIDVREYVKQSIKANPERPVKVLDVGSQNAVMLSELKKEFGNRVQTHALSPEDEPRGPVDVNHLAMAEYLPEEFREAFDLIVSHRALEYGVFPHIALRNIKESIAPGGIADFEFCPYRIIPPIETDYHVRTFKRFNGPDEPRPAWSRMESDLYKAFGPHRMDITGPAWNLLAAKLKSIHPDWEYDQIENELIKQLHRPGQQEGWQDGREILWLNEVGELMRDPRFTVEIPDWTGSSRFGIRPGIPGRLIIRRNRDR